MHEIHLAQVDLSHDEVVLVFSDGTVAVYDAEFLYHNRSRDGKVVAYTED